MNSGEEIKYILKPISDKKAIIEGFIRYRGETIRVENGILYYMGWKFKQKR